MYMKGVEKYDNTAANLSLMNIQNFLQNEDQQIFQKCYTFTVTCQFSCLFPEPRSKLFGMHTCISRYITKLNMGEKNACKIAVFLGGICG
jgi:hypothetical protein